METNPAKWGKSHEALAKKHLKKKGIIGSRIVNLPKLPRDPLEWIKAARPQVEGIKERSFLVAPFWVSIYEDQANSIMVMGGRQIYKSTYCTDCLAFEATSNTGVQVCYISYDEPNLSSFSKQKLQVGTFLQNSILDQFPRHKTGNVHEISLKNGSTIYLTTDNHEYKHVEGKSLNLCILDEAQYQDIQFIGKVYQTMMATKGKIKVLGIGGEAGSPYEKLWLQTNQMEWKYNDPNWRDRLQFDENGLVVGNYLCDVLSGKWIAQNPNATLYHGYHLPQTIFPTIPLTEEDAENKYKIHPRFSIEYQKKKQPESFFKSHVLGTFYKSIRRPITQEMVQMCTEPYRYLSLLQPEQVVELKHTFTNEIKIGMGVDFGSGPASSSTAIAILIWWRKPDRLQLVHIEKRPQENQLEQAQYIAELFMRYSCDVGVGDLGYGAIQVKQIQDGGYNNQTGQPYAGVSKSKFFGCRTISDETKPILAFDEKIDEHGEEVGRLQIDKTSSIESLIEAFEKSVPHPVFNLDKKKSRQRLMIPSKHDYEIDSLTADLTSLTRKDLSTVEDSALDDSRQRPRKEFNHPPDNVMALIYALIAVKHEVEWHWVSA
jgi:hypothetical protein